MPIASEGDIVDKGAVVGELVEGRQGKCPGEEGKDGDVSEEHADSWEKNYHHVCSNSRLGFPFIFVLQEMYGVI